MNIYYQDYRLKVVEIGGKYIIYDSKFGDRSTYYDIDKEQVDIFLERILSRRSKRKRKEGNIYDKRNI